MNYLIKSTLQECGINSYERFHARTCKIKHVPIEIGKYDVRQKGKNVALIGIGKSFEDVEAVAEKMKKDFPDINPYLINARWMKPVDESILTELEKKVKIIFTIEENSLLGGFGDSIKTRFVNTKIDVHSFGIPDQFVTYGTTEELKQIVEVSTGQIYNKIKKILK